MTDPWALFGDDESAARRLAEWILVESVPDLQRRTQPSATAYEQLGVAAILRRLLLDKHPVLHRARSRLGLPEPVFEFVPHREPEIERAPTGLQMQFQIGSLDRASPTHSTGLEGFLAARAGTLFGAPVTVRDVIRHFAHAHGGVHLGAPESSFERVVQRIASVAPGHSIWTLGLASIGRVAARAMTPLATELRENPYPPPDPI